MQAIFQGPIVNILFEVMDHQTIISFLTLCHCTRNYAYKLYELREFRYSDVKNQSNEYKSKIQHLMINDGVDIHGVQLSEYTKLKTIAIKNRLFNEVLSFIPTTIEEITIKSNFFNCKIQDNFPNLKKLSIDSLSFNSEIDKTLLGRLDQCTIRSPTYTQLKKDKNIKVKSLMFGINASKIDQIKHDKSLPKLLSVCQ